MRSFFAFNMKPFPNWPYQSQIDAISKRFNHQDERFIYVEAKIDDLSTLFEKLPMFNQPQTPPKDFLELLVRESDHCK